MPSPFSFSETNHFTQKLFKNLKRHPKRIVFAEGEDIRVLRVAEKMIQLEIAVPILLGNRESILSLAEKESISMTFISVIDPRTSSEIDLFCKRLLKTSRYRGKEVINPCDIVSRPLNFAAIMVQYGHADGMLAGNLSMQSSVFRAASTIIKPNQPSSSIFGAMILVPSPHLKNFGLDNVLFLADCGVIPDPNVKELASIAVETGKLARHFLGRQPHIGMLSHSTKSSSKTTSSQKVQAATELALQMIEKERLNIKINGELQADVALNPVAAEIKLTDQSIQKASDILIFPNLDAGHIALNLLTHIGGAQPYGQLIMGLSRPVAQVPRIVTEESLLGTAAVLGIRAINFHNLYLDNQS